MNYEDGEVFVRCQLAALVRAFLFEKAIPMGNLRENFLTHAHNNIIEFPLDDDEKKRLCVFAGNLIDEFRDNVCDFIKEL